MADAMTYFNEVVLSYEKDQCLDWPFYRIKGYANVWLNGKNTNVCRLLCAIVNGPAPSSHYHAAHSCGRGKMGCVNPRHLAWKTRSENEKDKITHGTSNRGERHGNALLSTEDVIAIKSLKGLQSQAVIASKFGVSQTAISDIHTGRRWSHVR